MEIRWKLHFYGHICTDLGISIAGDTEEKEKLKKLSKWGKWQIAKFSHTSKIRNSLYCNVDFELIQPIELVGHSLIQTSPVNILFVSRTSSRRREDVFARRLQVVLDDEKLLC